MTPEPLLLDPTAPAEPEPEYIGLLNAMLAHATTVCAGWGLLPRIEQDMLKIVAHAYEGWDDLPEDVDSAPNELPEVHIHMVMPPTTLDETPDEYIARWRTAMECEVTPGGKYRPARLEFNMFLTHPTGTLTDASNFIATRQDSTWTVTHTSEVTHD